MEQIKTPHLCDMLTSDLFNGDTDREEDIEKSTFNSQAGKELLKRGKETIPKIGIHLKTFDSKLKGVATAEEIEAVKRGWVLLLSQIVIKEKIHMFSITTTFEAWRDWAENYKPS